MPGILSFDGSTVYTPADDGVSAPTIPWPINKRIALSFEKVVELALTSDAPVVVALDGMTVNLLRIEATGKVDVTLTSADGSAQVIAVDDFLVLGSKSVAYTAVSLTRAAGVATTVAVQIGQI